MPDATLHHLLSRGTTRLMIHFLLHPEWKLHFRALKEHMGLGTGSLQRELAKLEALGLVIRVRREKLSGRLAAGSGFVKRVMAGPKRWLTGSEKVFAALPEAA